MGRWRRTLKVIGAVVGGLALLGIGAAGPPPPSGTTPGDGTFAVGTAPGGWSPGTWSTTAAASGNCYWATLSDLSGSFSSVISNNNTAGPTTLQVGSGVAGVQVSGCDPWHKIG